MDFEQQATVIVSSLYKLLNKIRSIVKLYKQSSIIFAYFYNYIQSLPDEDQMQKKGLIYDFVVRWNSTYLMLNRISEFRGVVDEVTSEPDRIDG